MEITDVKVKLVMDRSDKLLGFCTITIHNDFVIRDLKIIEGPKGAFVAMPSRKLTDRCPRCGGKNHRLAKFCNGCGAKLSDSRPRRGNGGRARLHADIAHPITSECREFVQEKVLVAFDEEVERSRQEGYVPPDLDADFQEDASDGASRQQQRREPAEPPRAAPERKEPAPPEPSRAREPQREAPPPPGPSKPPEPERRETPPPVPGEDSEDNFSSGIFR